MQTITLDQFRAIFGNYEADKSPYAGAHERGCLLALAAAVDTYHATFAEIGIQEGRTAAMLLGHFPNIAEYWGYDVPPGTRMPIRHQNREVPAQAGRLVSDRRLHVVVTGRGAMDLGHIMTADFVYIDGDHSRGAVEWDTKLARDATNGKRRSVIVWHDYGNPGTPDVTAVIDADPSPRLVRIASTWIVFEFGGCFA